MQRIMNFWVAIGVEDRQQRQRATCHEHGDHAQCRKHSATGMGLFTVLETMHAVVMTNAMSYSY